MNFTTPKSTVLPLMELQGKPYLQPAHRLVWFREEHPDWAILSSYLPAPEGFVLAEVVIKDASGTTLAQAHSLYPFAENAYESAETGAMGRALAWLGYGTQFAGDVEKVVDSPIQPSVPSKPQAPKVITNHAPKAKGAVINSFQPMDLSYRVDFGKYNGKSLQELTKPVAESYADHLANEARKTGNPLTGKALKFVEAVSAAWGPKESIKQVNLDGPPLPPPPDFDAGDQLPY